ncbi:uncharacterized protein LOC120126580 [Hibiscus syriacus]|uniref:uncharacterized protein LOC120126580 n=1 Tax=Hibiscus syriacus TaxID=106335 RepID=UPI001921E222|nr:uncharacterized protein LOC120126580 [Hibiscus syriacus]XP_039000672.1 uncharacterized protein LOC120126580 [Hibiscus syriacus]
MDDKLTINAVKGALQHSFTKIQFVLVFQLLVQLRMFLESCHGSFAAPTPTATDIHQDPVCSGISTSTPVQMLPQNHASVHLLLQLSYTLHKVQNQITTPRNLSLIQGQKFSLHLLQLPISGFSYGTNSSKCVLHARQLSFDGCCWFSARGWDGHICTSLSAPSKFVSYGNITPETGVSVAQFSQHIVGHMGGRTQPEIRWSISSCSGYTSILEFKFAISHVWTTGTAHCVPVSHDLVQGATTLSPLQARPLTAHQSNYQNQGSAAGQAFQLCVHQLP